jgi:hypothetical protein
VTAASDAWLRRLLNGIVAVMTAVVVTVAGLAFVASFGAIHDYALRSGGLAPPHAWMAPLFVDSFLFIGSAADLWLALTRTPDDTARLRWLDGLAPKALLVSAASASYGLNTAHAPATWPARTVAAPPPTALVVTELLLLFIVRRAVRLHTTQPDPSETAPAAPKAGSADPAQVIATLQARGVNVNGTAVARELGTSARHGRRLLARYRAQHPDHDGDGARGRP